MKTLSIIVISIAFFAQAHAQGEFEGEWETTYGELRLTQFENKVIGFYSNVGRIEGVYKTSSKSLKGTFTNGKDTGEFYFAILKNGEFSGVWNWKGSKDREKWIGTRKSVKNPGRWAGQWDTMFGRVCLVEKDMKVIGFYRDLGVIEAKRAEGFKIEGTFTNKSQTGKFKWDIVNDNFEGTYGWTNNYSEGKWNGTRVPIVEKRADIVIHSGLTNTQDFNLKKIENIVLMQDHIYWVSKEEENDVKKALSANAYELLGNEIISTGGVLNERIRCYVARKGKDVTIVFRGTKAVGNAGQTFINTIVTDGNALQVKPGFLTDNSLYKYAYYRTALVHKGFNTAYMAVRPSITKYLNTLSKDDNIYVFGHSLGGALATLCALDISINYNRRFASLSHIVSGSPRVGDKNFKDYFEYAVKNNLRVVINHDPIPTIPNFLAYVRPETKYQHVGNLLHMGKDGVLVTDDIDVTLNIRQFGFHNNENYRYASKLLLDRAKGNSGVYSKGKNLLISTANKERELSDKIIKRF